MTPKRRRQDRGSRTRGRRRGASSGSPLNPPHGGERTRHAGGRPGARERFGATALVRMTSRRAAQGWSEVVGGRLPLIVRDDPPLRLRGSMRSVRSLRVLCLITVALLGAACTSAAVSTTTSSPTMTTTAPRHSSPTVAVDLSATPTGWLPVAYGDAQVSVPGLFTVIYLANGLCQVEMPAGMLVVGAPVGSYGCEASRTYYVHPTLMSIKSEGASRPTASETRQTINGITVFAVPGRLRVNAVSLFTYDVPSLGVEIIAGGPLARRVLATLTRSPRTVALASGPAPSVPSGWHTVAFSGLRFEAPLSWPVTETAVIGDNLGPLCGRLGVAFTNPEVTLSTDRRRFPIVSCLASPDWPRQPDDGVEVDAGNFSSNLPVALSFSRNCLHISGLTACPATSPSYSILFLKVTVPGRVTPDLVSIGLAGSGLVARTILYSLRAA